MIVVLHKRLLGWQRGCESGGEVFSVIARLYETKAHHRSTRYGRTPLAGPAIVGPVDLRLVG